MNQEEKTRRSRELILEAAVEEFGENTYEKASLTQMCSRNGISKGRLYHHFQDKDEIYLAALTYCYETVTAKQQEAVEGYGSDLRENLMSLIAARSEVSLKNPYMPVLIWGAMHRPPEALREETEKIVSHYQQETSKRIRLAIAACAQHDTIDADICTEAVAMVHNHGAYHAIRRWDVHDPKKNLRTVQENRVYIEKFIDMILYGVLKE